MAENETLTIGRYQLLAKIATGGMAEIWLARQTGIGGFEKIVVVKRILPHLSTEEAFVEMFLDEAVIAAQLNHPNVVQIYDLGQAGDDYFIAMEYLEGESLGHLVTEGAKGGNPITPHMAAGILAQVCDGLHYAHTFEDDSGNPLNIVHRDVSPHNIIVLFTGMAKVVDFGIAKAATKMHQTQVGTLKGKLAYMAPEQCMGQNVDARSDIFALGVVLWELLTRRRLFKRDAEPAIIRAIMDEPVPTVRSVRESVPEGLAAVADQALRKEPEGRFQSAGAMGAALRAALQMEGQTIGPQKIAAYANEVFGDHARTKKKLLQDIREKGASGVAVRTLKVKSESMPSQSYMGDAAAVQALQAETVIRPSDEVTPEPAPPPVPTEPAPGEGKGPSPSVEIPPPEPDEAVRATQPLPAAQPAEPAEPAAQPAGLADALEPVEGETFDEDSFVQPPKKKTGLVIGLVLGVLLIGGGVGGYLYWQSTQTPGTAGPNKPEPLKPMGTDAGVVAEQPKPDAGAADQPEPDAGTLATAPAADADTEQPKPADAVQVAVVKQPDPVKPDPVKPDPVKPDPVKPDPVKPDPPKLALLSVSSRPAGCEVEVDGVPVGASTPLKDLEIAPKQRHKVAVLCEGHKKQVKPIRGKPGQKVKLAFAPRKIHKPGPDRPIKPPPPKGKGKLLFNTTPWTEVYLGKKRLGMTPLRKIELPAGRHKLTLINKSRKIKKTVVVVIKPNEVTKKLMNLE